MCMTLTLDNWETVSLTAGCNLYSTHFRLCVLTVRSADDQGFRRDSNMYFRERDKPVVDAETFLATAVPKILIGCLIIFLNLLAIMTMFRSNKWISNGHRKGFYVLPQSTQGLLHSLFVAYLTLGILTLYSQVSLSTFILADYRLFEDQGKECLTVNCVMIAISVSISLHLVSLAVDRTLSSYLPFSKYSSLSRGTVPLWLLAIWLPSIILGSLPMAGWKTNFSFCIFLHQFNDDYLRFVSGFYLTNILLIPCLYFFFLAVLKPQKDPRVMYRWHRKLQAHHRLTFALVLAVNIICWTPFHLYLLSACLTCPYSYLASGFTLEYLYMVALVPSLLIPLMFSIRSSVVDKCATKISRCVHFNEDQLYETHNNPMSQRSPLFFINDNIHSLSLSNSNSNSNSNSSRPNSLTKKGSSGSERIHGNGTVPVKSSSFFVTPYLPTTEGISSAKIKVNSKTKSNSNKTASSVNNTNSSNNNNKKKNSSGNNNDNDNNKNTNNKYVSNGGGGEARNKAPLRNFCAYLNRANHLNSRGSNNNNSSVATNLSSDSQYGFPIIPTNPNLHPKTNYANANNSNNTPIVGQYIKNEHRNTNR